MSNIDELKESTQVDDEVVEVPETFRLADESEYTSEPDETEESEEVVVVEKPAKKKFPLQGTIIVALCLVVGAFITYLALALMMPTVEGTWYYETSDGVKIYYTIEEKEDGEHYFEIAYGTAYYPGVYEINPNGVSSSINLKADYNAYIAAQPYAQGELLFPECLDGTYTYSTSGNKLFGECTLNLDDGNGTVITLKYVEKPELTDYVKPYTDFKVNKSILGEWQVDNSMYGMPPTVVKFNDDGSMSIDNYGLYVTQFMYSPVDNVIKMAGFGSEKVEQELEFELKNGNLIFGGMAFTRPGETPKAPVATFEQSVSTSDQAK